MENEYGYNLPEDCDVPEENQAVAYIAADLGLLGQDPRHVQFKSFIQYVTGYTLCSVPMF